LGFSLRKDEYSLRVCENTDRGMRTLVMWDARLLNFVNPQPFIRRHGITSRKTWTYSNTAMITSKLSKIPNTEEVLRG
jgi:hypothetical protein